MSRHIDFRNQLYMALCCIFLQLLNILFSVESVACQFRICFNPYTPALVVRQMKLQRIVFVFHHLINVEFNIVDRKEITSRVEHQRTVAETRAVINFDSRNSLLLGSAYIASH